MAFKFNPFKKMESGESKFDAVGEKYVEHLEKEDESNFNWNNKLNEEMKEAKDLKREYTSPNFPHLRVVLLRIDGGTTLILDKREADGKITSQLHKDFTNNDALKRAENTFEKIQDIFTTSDKTEDEVFLELESLFE